MGSVPRTILPFPTDEEITLFTTRLLLVFFFFSFSSHLSCMIRVLSWISDVAVHIEILELKSGKRVTRA
jgi:hypothetical protein